MWLTKCITMYKPVKDLLLVKRIEDTVSEGGILLPEERDILHGIVKGVGPDVFEKDTLKEGARVIFGRASGATSLGDNHIFIKEAEIFGVIEND